MWSSHCIRGQALARTVANIPLDLGLGSTSVELASTALYVGWQEGFPSFFWQSDSSRVRPELGWTGHELNLRLAFSAR
jgi:hypothetical protein